MYTQAAAHSLNGCFETAPFRKASKTGALPHTPHWWTCCTWRVFTTAHSTENAMSKHGSKNESEPLSTLWIIRFDSRSTSPSSMAVVTELAWTTARSRDFGHKRAVVAVCRIKEADKEPALSKATQRRSGLRRRARRGESSSFSVYSGMGSTSDSSCSVSGAKAPCKLC